MRGTLLRRSTIGVALGIVSCGGSSNDAPLSVGGSNAIAGSGGSDSNGGSGAIHTGGAPGSTLAAGGNSTPATGGTAASDGGASSTASLITGGVQASGGSNSANAGSIAAGGISVGGKSTTGGAETGGAPTGGNSATGSMITGGATGGKSVTGGATASATGSGGAPTGGNSATGGMATGGKSTTGGAETGGASSTSTGLTGPCAATNTLTGGTPHCNQNTSGSYGNYEWQLWSNQSKGCLTTYTGAGAAFSASWDNSGDLLARVGLVFDGTKTYEELGTMSAEFSETRTGTAGAFSYIGVYGFALSPTFEFYIVEDSFVTMPIKPSVSKLTTFQVDGGTYDIYAGKVSGTSMTTELYSVRQTARRCGHISISEHFSQWATAGQVLGKLAEVRLFVETGGGTGSIDFTTADVVVQ